MLRNLFNDETGVIISAELVLVLTVGILATIVGLTEVTVAINTELNDVSNAIGALNQSFVVTGFTSGGSKVISAFAGTLFVDSFDDCDLNTTCDLVAGASASSRFEGPSL